MQTQVRATIVLCVIYGSTHVRSSATPIKEVKLSLFFLIPSYFTDKASKYDVISVTIITVPPEAYGELISLPSTYHVARHAPDTLDQTSSIPRLTTMGSLNNFVFAAISPFSHKTIWFMHSTSVREYAIAREVGTMKTWCIDINNQVNWNYLDFEIFFLFYDNTTSIVTLLIKCWFVFKDFQIFQTSVLYTKC